MKSLLSLFLAFATIASPIEAGEIIKRSFGTDENGNEKTIYVYQAGRSHRSTSGTRRARSYDFPYGSGYYFGSFPVCHTPVFIPRAVFRPRHQGIRGRRPAAGFRGARPQVRIRF